MPRVYLAFATAVLVAFGAPVSASNYAFDLPDTLTFPPVPIVSQGAQNPNVPAFPLPK